jgi:hypothetical protein
MRQLRSSFDAEIRLFRVELSAVRQDVSDQEESRTWIRRLLAGAFVYAFVCPIVVALVITR